jgi:hypothetical protein
VVAIPLAWFAAQVLASRDAHRWVAGFLVAAVAWFGIVYPNISGLPLPSAVANAYQGVLPTYLYAFQFPVSEADRNVATPLASSTFALLLAAIAITAIVVAYSASTWRLALAGSRAADASGGPSDPSGEGRTSEPGPDLARSGGGA